MSLAVANQYAKALLEVVSKPGSPIAPPAALDQLDIVLAAQRESRDLNELLMTPAIGREQKAKALVRVGEVLGLDPVMSNFLRVVANHRRANLLGAIRDMFQAQLDEQTGVVRANVKAARDLTEAQRSDVAAALRQTTGKQVLCDFSVDPSLVGGLTVTMGSTVYDGSVQGRLEGLRRRLASQA